MIDVNTGAAETPLVLLHGATASARVWSGLLPTLQASRRVIVPTLAGHLGGPPISAPPARIVEEIVNAACRQLDEAGVDRAHIVGNSLGGWVALELARRERARSVLALSPAGAWRTPADLRRITRLFRVGVYAGQSKRLRSLADVTRIRRIMLRNMAEHADRMTPTQVSDAFNDMTGCSVLSDLLTGAREAGPITEFESITCPIRIAWGSHDRMLPFKRYGAPMLKAVPGAEFMLLPGVGHVPMIDDPSLIARTILEFVEKVV